MRRNSVRVEVVGRAGARTRAGAWSALALWSVIAGTAVLALQRLYVGFHSLLFGSGRQAAVDIMGRWEETRRWFAGQPVYGVLQGAIYPPTSYALFWPFIGWLPEGSVRWVWAAVTVASLGALTAILIRAARAVSWPERVFWVLAVPAAQSTSNLIASGQLTLPLLTLVVAAVLLVRSEPPTVGRRLAAALLALVALAKPSVAAPFMWRFVFGTGTLWPIAVVVVGYGATTALAALVQPAGFLGLVDEWLAAVRHVTATLGYGNVQSWLSGWGLGSWVMPASLAVFTGFGVWVAWRRREDTLLLAGVAALVARLWTYHQNYDDVLLLVPVVFLWRAANDGGTGDRLRLASGVTSTWTWFVLLAPGRFALLPDSAEPTLNVIRTATWLLVLAVTLAVGRARRLRDLKGTVETVA